MIESLLINVSKSLLFEIAVVASFLLVVLFGFYFLLAFYFKKKLNFLERRLKFRIGMNAMLDDAEFQERKELSRRSNA